MKSYKFFTIILAILLPTMIQAQTLKVNGMGGSEYVLPATDTVSVGFNSDFITIPVSANCDYDVTPNDSWVNVKKETNGNLTIFSGYNFESSERYGSATITSADGKFSRQITVKQGANAMSNVSSDIKLTGITATDTNHNGTQTAILTLDGDVSSLYHSNYSGGGFPITLTYTFNTTQHVDYVVYTPRQDGNNNGNFKVVTVEYKVGTSSTWTELKTIDLGGSGSATSIMFGEEGIDNIKAVRFIVKSGANNFACCAEMQFFQKDRTLENELNNYFVDKLYTQLKEGVTNSDMAKIKNSLVKKFVWTMLQGEYETKFRLGEYEPFRPIGDLRDELKNSHTYCNHENPTGITFKQGETVAVIVEGLEEDPLALQIRNFGPEVFAASTYPLRNGINIIKTQNKGNGYINYYTSNYKTAPNVKIHIFAGTINGFLDLTKGDTNADWKRMLNAAPGDCFDFKTEYVIGTFPVAHLKQNTPTQGVELANSYNEIIRYEREVMGLFKYNRNPKNRQTVITVATSGGLYHASNDGFCVPVSALGSPTKYPIEFWGAAHEFGHNNQTTGFVYTGLTEVTNNIHSAWCQHKLEGGYHRLEDEAYGGPRGERIEAYLENGIRLGNLWQLQAGPDSYNKTFDEVTVNDVDENGTAKPSITTTAYNHDVFVKLVPLWQLMLYTEETACGYSPDAYAKLFEGLRTYSGNENSTNGKQQIKFMRTFCDSTKINFLPFFEKAGLLKAAHFYQSDYTSGWIVITQKMIDDLKSQIEAKNYPVAPEGLHWLTAYNLNCFRDKIALTEGTLNNGCSLYQNKYIKVDNTVWPGAVGYETYNAQGEHVANTVFGYNDNTSSTRYTYVKWPSGASYIMAVGYDGTKVKIYQK